MKKGITLFMVLVLALLMMSMTAFAEPAAEDAEVTIYLTRHGKTLFNTEHRVQGWCDTPLTEEGIEVAENLGLGLHANGVVFDAAYSSDLGRQRDTARLVLDQMEQTDMEVRENRGLRETCFGSWEGELSEVRDAAYCEIAGTESIYEIYPQGTLFYDITMETDETGWAEDFDTAQTRLLTALTEIAETAKENGEKTVLVVSSGGIINTIIPLLGGEGGELSNASVTMLYYNDGEFTLGVVGDMSYVEQGAEIRGEE